MKNIKIGSRVLQEAVRQAKRILGARLISCYGLGSIVHGGFVPHVSDVDIGIIIDTVRLLEDEYYIDKLFTSVSNLKIPMGDRLSIFWSSEESIKNFASIGRFPLIDKLDLIKHGKLIAGREIRPNVYMPNQKEIIIETTKYALELLGNEVSVKEIKSLAFLFDPSVRYTTKRILFPIRFLYTLRSSKPGSNDTAISYYFDQYAGPISELVKLAFHCRNTNTLPATNQQLINLANRHLISLYIELINACYEKMILYNEHELSKELEMWKYKLLSDKY